MDRQVCGRRRSGRALSGVENGGGVGQIAQAANPGPDHHVVGGVVDVVRDWRVDAEDRLGDVRAGGKNNLISEKRSMKKRTEHTSAYTQSRSDTYTTAPQ